MVRLLGGGIATLPITCMLTLLTTITTAAPTTQAGTSTCPMKGKPTGSVLQGYWENWNNENVHPGLGWTNISNPLITQHGYNVIAAAFPVILPDGTVLWEDGMDTGVIVPTPEEMCLAKANGVTILLSIGGATAAIDLSSRAVADKVISTLVPILKKYNFDGVDYDLESQLDTTGDINTLSTSQANFIYIIDGVLDAMGPSTGLTLAPETPSVTGASVVYGSIWGAYLPIIKKYVDNGRLWWLNMQYYNDDYFGCKGDSYPAGSVQGFIAQSDCLNAGLVVQGTTIKVPYDMQAPGLPAQVGASSTGYMNPSSVAQVLQHYGGQLKGLMTWSINWDGSKGWTFGDNVKANT